MSTHKHRDFRIAALVGVAAVVLATSACGTPATAPDSRPSDEVVVLHLGMVPGGQMNTLPARVAVDKGFFADEGLDVQIVELAGGPQMVQALAAKSIEVMSNSPTNGMIANGAGQDFVGIVGAFADPPYTVIARGDWPTPNEGKGYPEFAKDLKGATIGVPVLGSESENVMRTMIRDAGLNPDTDVQWVTIGGGQQAIGAFEAGQVDVFIATEPAPTVLIGGEKNAKALVDFRDPDQVPEPFRGWTSSIYQGNRAYVEANPETFAAFEAAITKAIEFIKTDRDGALEVYRTMLALDDETVQAVYDTNVHSLVTDVDCDTWPKMTDFLVTATLVPEARAQSCTDFMWEDSASIG